MSSEESRAVKYSYPIVSKLYKSLLEEFKSSYSTSTDSYKTLSMLVKAQLKKLEGEIGSEAVNAITPLAKSLMEKDIDRSDKYCLRKRKGYNSTRTIRGTSEQ